MPHEKSIMEGTPPGWAAPDGLTVLVIRCSGDLS